MRILLVDDDPTLLRLLRRALEREGHSVSACLSAEEAMRHYANQEAKPEWLVTDHWLPGASGVELAAGLLRQEPSMQAAVCSGFPIDLTGFPDAERARVRLIQKPFQVEELIELVARS
ncbi:MAG: response regulator [Acidobacteria bacterium]|nr:response regulator [Acidobacteriota bacterium]